MLCLALVVSISKECIRTTGSLSVDLSEADTLSQEQERDVLLICSGASEAPMYSFSTEGCKKQALHWDTPQTTKMSVFRGRYIHSVQKGLSHVRKDRDGKSGLCWQRGWQHGFPAWSSHGQPHESTALEFMMCDLRGNLTGIAPFT